MVFGIIESFDTNQIEPALNWEQSFAGRTIWESINNHKVS
jgi:hypothetical protein